jgi:putative flavoprotein involved in K+ transport
VNDIDVVVIGAGQGGLSISQALSTAGREHIVLERGRIGQSWCERWDSFTLVGPNWTIRLAGSNYDGSDPDGFMPRDDIVKYLTHYATQTSAPVHAGVEVTSLARSGDGFVLDSSAGTYRAREVVVATGGYQRQHRPRVVTELGDVLPVFDIADYRNPDLLPEGRVLVVGSGQSGCQIAEELALAGREVVLACGRAPWTPRRLGGHDVMWWIDGSKLAAMTLADLPGPIARLGANTQISGGAGGHDLNYRTLRALGVTLSGHLLGVRNQRVEFAADLADSVAFGDDRYRDFRAMVAELATQRGLAVPDLPDPAPFPPGPARDESVDDFGAVICATGYRPDYTSWVDLPVAFDDMGFPIQVDGSSTVVPGLHFMGIHFQRNRVSASLLGVGQDAELLARRMNAARTLGAPASAV